eukprot:199778_1
MSVVKNPSKVYIGNIPRDAEEGQIEKMFDEVGNSLSLEFQGDFAFVEYADAAIAEEAIRKFDGIRIRGRRLIVEPFRYRGGDPRYRRPPPKNVTRGEYRCIVTNLSGNTSAQDLRDWVEHEKLLSLTVTDVYNRHGLNEGVVEFQEKGDWDYMIRTMDRVKLDSHYVRVYDEREYNRRKLKVYDRPQGNKSGGRDRNRDRDRDRDRERPRSRSYSKGRGDRNRTRMQRNYRDNDRMNNRISNRSRDREPHREQRGRQRFRSNSPHGGGGYTSRNGRDDRGNRGSNAQDGYRRGNMSRSRSRSRHIRRDRGGGNSYNYQGNRDRRDRNGGQRQRYDNTQRGDRYDRYDRRW